MEISDPRRTCRDIPNEWGQYEANDRGEFFFTCADPRYVFVPFDDNDNKTLPFAIDSYGNSCPTFYGMTPFWIEATWGERAKELRKSFEERIFQLMRCHAKDVLPPKKERQMRKEIKQLYITTGPDGKMKLGRRDGKGIWLPSTEPKKKRTNKKNKGRRIRANNW